MTMMTGTDEGNMTVYTVTVQSEDNSEESEIDEASYRGKKSPKARPGGEGNGFQFAASHEEGRARFGPRGEVPVCLLHGEMSVGDTSESSQGSIRRTGMHGVSCCRHADRAAALRMPM